jgi:WD40 repeat protein
MINTLLQDQVKKLKSHLQGDNFIRIFDWNKGESKKLFEIKGHDADVNCVSWNPKIFNQLATCSDDKSIKIWNF